MAKGEYVRWHLASYPNWELPAATFTSPFPWTITIPQLILAPLQRFESRSWEGGTLLSEMIDRGKWDVTSDNYKEREILGENQRKGTPRDLPVGWFLPLHSHVQTRLPSEKCGLHPPPSVELGHGK